MSIVECGMSNVNNRPLSSDNPHSTLDTPIKMLSPRSVFADRLRDFSAFALTGESSFQHAGCWRQYFENRIGPSFNGQLVLDLGCSDAGFLSAIATKHPSTAFIGLDWKCKPIYLGARRIAEQLQRNITLIRGRASDLHLMFTERELDVIWVFQPEPCAEPAQLKNRLIAEPFLLQAALLLRDDSARLSIKTDHPGYFQWILGLFGHPEPQAFRAIREGSPERGALTRVRARDLMHPRDIPLLSATLRDRLHIIDCTMDFWNDPGVSERTSARYFAGETTAYESRFLRKRQPIYFLDVARTGSRDAASRS